jgi:hypothetical protein
LSESSCHNLHTRRTTGFAPRNVSSPSGDGFWIMHAKGRRWERRQVEDGSKDAGTAPLSNQSPYCSYLYAGERLGWTFMASIGATAAADCTDVSSPAAMSRASVRIWTEMDGPRAPWPFRLVRSSRMFRVMAWDTNAATLNRNTAPRMTIADSAPLQLTDPSWLRKAHADKSHHLTSSMPVRGNNERHEICVAVSE